MSPFGRLHEEAADDGKLLALTDSAWRMWGMGLIYCQRNLTDGFIPEHAIHSFGVRAPNKLKVADELCRVQVEGKAPLWSRAKGGFQVHDYLQWNDSKEQILAARAIGKTRRQLHNDTELLAQIRARDGSSCRYCARSVNWKDRKGPSGATYDHVDPQGGNTRDNVVVACRGCNSAKGSRRPDACGMHLLPPPRGPAESGPESGPESGWDLDSGQKNAHPPASGSGTGFKESKDPTNAELRRMPRLVDGPHLHHALCGRPCMHRRQFTDFLRKLGGNETAAEQRVTAWFDEVNAAYDGRPIPIADEFKFWNAEYDRKFGAPAAPKSEAKSTIETSAQTAAYLRDFRAQRSES